jgi:nucleoside-diphosphate-sugar epimerase
MFHRRDGTQILSFRIGNIVCPEDYAGLKTRLANPEARLRILWSYIDSRDLAIACRLAIERDGLGCEPVIVAADDTSSNVPTADLIQRFLPGVKTFKQPLTGRQSLISNARLKAVLGWQQQHHYPFD